MLIYRIEKAIDELQVFLQKTGETRLNTFYKAVKETPDMNKIVHEYINSLIAKANIILRSFLNETV